MKIIIAGSISSVDKILEVKKKLEGYNHEVEIPEGIKNEFLRGRTEVSKEEKARDKIEHDLIRDYYEKISKHDALLIVNIEKHGIKDYIGGNTFLEMGFAHVLDKSIYILNEIPNIGYKEEIMAMQPIVLKGNLQNINS